MIRGPIWVAQTKRMANAMAEAIFNNFIHTCLLAMTCDKSDTRLINRTTTCGSAHSKKATAALFNAASYPGAAQLASFHIRGALLNHERERVVWREISLQGLARFSFEL